MPDCGHDIGFGYFLIPDASDPRGVLETALLTDRLGYDLLAVQDHPYQRRHLDALTLLAPDPKMLHTFIDEVAPQVRDRVAVARG